jgi:hypothetical protein
MAADAGPQKTEGLRYRRKVRAIPILNNRCQTFEIVYKLGLYDSHKLLEFFVNKVSGFYSAACNT